MADGVPGVENILKIGFLNDKVGMGPDPILVACFFFFFDFLLKFILGEREREREHTCEPLSVSRGGAGRESQAASAVSAQSPMQVDLNPTMRS